MGDIGSLTIGLIISFLNLKFAPFVPLTDLCICPTRSYSHSHRSSFRTSTPCAFTSTASATDAIRS